MATAMIDLCHMTLPPENHSVARNIRFLSRRCAELFCGQTTCHPRWPHWDGPREYKNADLNSSGRFLQPPLESSWDDSESDSSRSGGIGRRARLRAWFLETRVQVQVLSPAPSIKRACGDESQVLFCCARICAN